MSFVVSALNLVNLSVLNISIFYLETNWTSTISIIYDGVRHGSIIISLLWIHYSQAYAFQPAMVPVSSVKSPREVKLIFIPKVCLFLLAP